MPFLSPAQTEHVCLCWLAGIPVERIKRMYHGRYNEDIANVYQHLVNMQRASSLEIKAHRL